MFTFSFVGSSFGFAIPNDAKIEKVFKQDVEKVSLDIVSIDFESQKIAVNEFVRYDLFNLTDEKINYCFEYIKKPITLNRRFSHKTFNYNLPIEIATEKYNLPLKVGWNK